MTDNIQQEIEDKIIDCINFGVAGRLIIFKPEKNIFGADLAIEKRANYKGKEIYFKTSSFLAPAQDSIFVKDFPQENFQADGKFYLLFVYFDEVAQKMGEHAWLIPSLKFRDTADVVKLSYTKNLLRFETCLNIKNKNKYSKFIVSTKELGKLILNGLDKDGKLDFKENFEDKKPINLESLKELLCEARQNTYAASATGVDNPRLLASTQLEFQKADYFYRDIFFSGSKKIIGQEIVYLESKPIWGMNYMGNRIEVLQVAFLKESLLKLAGKCRIGGMPSGSCEYEKREFKYQDRGQGVLSDFFGKEEIFLENKSIYKLNYQGGLISDK